ncbi:hypothetical protein ABIF65_002392 [Bradyrhizobium japonicum]|nr:hypothetical protein [Bradyrhizobium japonicum]MCP1780791.1 hypothetical protein [Bradyrhizobium japonicum]MCP1860136.1 hypothetical protein [Bradyrhizobium japonicum]MCP1890901.1 hypothetical protein [Bradyrhizobium japonicum]MCP1956217.1 hypothetical protein [Bradyrhizobium japonicum]
MSNWIDSGGDEPRLYSVRPTICETQRPTGGAPRWRSMVSLACAWALIALAAPSGHARDRGQFVNTNAELKAWFDGLRSGKGPCCSDADGSALSDTDWESKDGHYRVRIPRLGHVLDGQQQEFVWLTCPRRPSSRSRTGSGAPWCGRSTATWASPSAALCLAA